MAATALEDEMEVDELANVPKELKTKEGYLKDGFVVSDEGDEDECGNNEDSISESEVATNSNDDEDEDEDVVIEDIGSELSEESYDYESDE